MDSHAFEYYKSYSEETGEGHFHEVISLQEEPSLSWEAAFKLAPCLIKGWYELAHLSPKDKIELVHDFWLSKLPYHETCDRFLDKFFASLDDIGVYLVQKKYDLPFEAHLVYSRADNSGFFQGYPPLDDESLMLLQKEFKDLILPADYVAFLQIHNGFAKQKDTGILSANKLKPLYQEFQTLLSDTNTLLANRETPVNPNSLIPFYQSFDLPFFQCFWSEWYPKQEMGNVYYSGLNKTIILPDKEGDSCNTMAFETFIDWLLFYIEKID